jgi:hypothetical protein
MYAEITEAMDSSVDGDREAITGDEEEEEDEREPSTPQFPQLIAQEPTETNEATAPSEPSVSGSTRGKYRQLADALYLEAQEVCVLSSCVCSFSL